MPQSNQRIVFIDMMRAYAILMMVQGHLTDSCLDPVYRNSEFTLYYIWNFMRGITAPIFFFSSGMIFTYLLFRTSEKGETFKNFRIKKGLKRIAELLFWGYLLRFNFWFLLDAIDGQLESSYKGMIAIDVLHIIAIAILFIILIYLISYGNKKMFLPIAIIFAMSSFIAFPYVTAYEFEMVPNIIANYFTKMNGSTFTVIPWVSYSLFGACLGLILNKNPKFILNYFSPIILIALGFLMHFKSWHFLNYISSDIEVLISLRKNAYLFERLGHVFIISGIMVYISLIWKKIPPIIPKIGAETLLIYVVHAFVIYGAIYQFGIAQYFGKSLTPWECFFLALFLEIGFISLVYYIDRIRLKLSKINPIFSNFLK